MLQLVETLLFFAAMPGTILIRRSPRRSFFSVPSAEIRRSAPLRTQILCVFNTCSACESDGNVVFLTRVSKGTIRKGAHWFRRGCWKPWLQVEAPLAS